MSTDQTSFVHRYQILIAAIVGALITVGGGVLTGAVPLPGHPSEDEGRLEVQNDTLQARLDRANRQASRQAATIDRLSAKVVVLTDSVRSLLARAPASLSQAGPTGRAVSFVAERDGFRISIQACTRSGSEVACTVRLLNMQADRRLRIYGYGSSRRFVAFTGTGAQHFVTRISVGDRGERGSVGVSLLQNEPVDSVIRFGGISATASILTTLSMVFTHDGGDIEVRHQNVPIEG